MIINKKLSLIACSIVAGGVFLTGCGSSGSSSSGTSLSLSKVAGKVTASTFENATVCLDLNYNGSCDSDEPTSITNKDGEFEIDYILDANTEYLLIAKGNANTKRYDDNGTLEDNATDLLMFTSYTSQSENNINALTMQSFLQDLKTTGAIDTNSTFLDTNETNQTVLYNDFLDNNKSNQSFSTILVEAARFLEVKNKNNAMEAVKEDLGLDTNSILVFDSSDANESTLAQQGAFKTKTNPAKIGNLVVSKPLEKVEIEVVTSVDDSNITGVSANDTNESATSTQNSVILKKPIFAVVGDSSNKIKVVIGNKTAIADLGDITLSVTPYDEIISIPYYDQIKDANLSVMLGADITVENSSGERVAVSEMATKAISGVILDKHKEDLNASELKYYYLDGNTWTDGGNITDGGNLTLTDNFKLVPYLLVKENDMQAETTITVDGLDKIKDPVVVVKGKSTATTTNSKLLAKSSSDSESNLILDATSNTTGNTASFKIPNGFEISEIVVIGDQLDEFTENDEKSIKTEVSDNGTASIIEETNLIVGTSLISGIETYQASALGKYFSKDSLSLPYYGYNSAVTAQSDDKQKFYYIIGTNVDNFIGDGNNTFYDGSDINASTTMSWEDNTTSATEKYTYDILISPENKTISKTEKTLDMESGALKVTKAYTYTFDTPNQLTKERVKTHADYKDGDDSYYTNKVGTVYSSDITFKKEDENTTIAVINNHSSNYSKLGYHLGETYTSTRSDSYKGTVKYNKSSENDVAQVIDGRVTQYFNKTNNTYSGTDKHYVNGLLEFNATNLTFTGDTSYSSTYNDIEYKDIHSIIEDATYSFDSSNDNVMSIVVSSGTNTHTTGHDYLSNISKFTTSWLDGKTLYSVYTNSTSWAMTGDSYNTTTLSSKGLINESLSEEVDYNITSNGAITFTNQYNEVEYVNIIPALSTNDYLKVCWGSTNTTSCTESDREYLFLDKTKAETKLYSEMSEGSWSGSYSVSGGAGCYSGTLSSTMSDSYKSWSAQDTAGDSYSGSVTQSGNTFNFKEYSYDSNSYTTVGTGSISSDGTSITGTWSDDGCTGTFELEKSTATAVKGILSNAKVCSDVNGNKACDIDEPYSFTQNDGTFDISKFNKKYTYVLESDQNSFDKQLNKPFVGSLVSLKDNNNNVVSVFTTLVSLMDNKTSDDSFKRLSQVFDTNENSMRLPFLHATLPNEEKDKLENISAYVVQYTSSLIDDIQASNTISISHTNSQDYLMVMKSFADYIKSNNVDISLSNSDIEVVKQIKNAMLDNIDQEILTLKEKSLIKQQIMSKTKLLDKVDA